MVLEIGDKMKSKYKIFRILGTITAILFSLVDFNHTYAKESRSEIRERMTLHFRETFRDLIRGVDNMDKMEGVLDINEYLKADALLIRVRPKVGFKIPASLKLMIIPEAELCWQANHERGPIDLD